MVLHTGFPPDIRVEKEIQALKEEHNLSLLCVKKGNQAADESLNGVTVKRVFSSAQRWWARLWLMARCRSKSWEHAIEAFVVEKGIEALHVHDLPLLGVALAVGRRHNIPVVSDLHENYPAMIAARLSVPLLMTGSMQQVALRLVTSVEQWAEYERVTVPRADQIITVIEEARERLVGQGISPDKIHVVGNYASMDDISEQPEHSGKSFTLVYAGGFGATRDLPTVVRAVSLIDRAAYTGLQVILVGGKDRTYDQLRKLSKDLGVSDCVRVLRWLPQAKAEQLMLDADVGLVPHVKSPHTDATVPHKLFQYMWRRLPVIVSDCAPLQRIASETGCGLVYRSGEAEELSKNIEILYNDRELLQRMGEAGFRAVKERYNWNAAGEALRNIYRQLVRRT